MRPVLAPRPTLPFTVALLCSLAAGPAFAHAHLVAAEPPAGGAVSAGPSRLELTFTEGVNPAFSGLSVTGPGGAVPLGAAAHGPGGAATLAVPVGQPLPPGSYRVEWHALAADGHRSQGEYGFTVRP